MKRLLALLLVLAAVLCVGCAGEDPAVTTAPSTAAPSDNTTQAPTTEPTEPPTTEPTEPPTMANDYFSPEDCPELIDTWTMDVVLDGALMNLTDMESSVTMKLRYQFYSDGTYTRGVEQKEYDIAIAAYESFINTYMLSHRYNKFVAEKKLEGKKDKAIEAEWNQNGWPQAQMEIDEFVKGLHLGYRFSGLNRSGDYYTEDNVPYPFEIEPGVELIPQLVKVLYLSKEDGTYEKCVFDIVDGKLHIIESMEPELYNQLKLEFPLVLKTGMFSTATEIIEPTEPTEATEAAQ